LIKFSILSS